ncbi:MAG: aspartate aminotransferase family protein [bacterium]
MTKMSLPYYISWSKQDAVATLPIASNRDCTMILEDGQELLDLSGISFQAGFGLNNPVILKAMSEQIASSLSISSPKAQFQLKDEMAQKLINLIGLEGKIFWTVSGAESVENALKMIRLATGKHKILARKRSYHGATMGALAATGDWRHDPFFPDGSDTIRIPEPSDDPDLTKTRDLISQHGPDNIAAFIIETVTGGNGVWVLPTSWWQGIQDLCDEFDIKLIVDEVVTGFYRTGKAMGFHHYPVKPDAVCMAKAITGGFAPFGAVWTAPWIAKHFEDNILACGLTNYGHPLGLAALSGVFKLIEDPAFHLRLKENIEIFNQKLNQIEQHKNIKAIRKLGLLGIIEHKGKITFEEYQKVGLFVYNHEGDAILSPAMTMQPAQLSDGLDKLIKVICEKSM